MDRKDNQDALDSILDSITMDDTMERKIHEFSQNKQRSRRIQRARDESAKFQETYSTARKEAKESQEEIVLDHQDYHHAASLQNNESQAVNPAKNSLDATRTFMNPNTASTRSSLRPETGSSTASTYHQMPEQNSVEQTIIPGQMFTQNHSSAQAEHTQVISNIPHTNVYDQASARHVDPLNQTINAGAGFHQNPDPLTNTRIADAGSHTMVFGGMNTASAADSYNQNSNQVHHASVMNTRVASGGGTMVMDESQLHNLQDYAGDGYGEYYEDYPQEEEPMLKREYVHEQYTAPKPRKRFSWKIPVMVGTLVLIVSLGLGAWQFVSGWMGNIAAKTEEKSQNYYDQLMAWAQGYAGLSDAEKKDITSLERVYNRLNETQRSEIDKVLTTMTGKTFNELLASVSDVEKEDPKNNNTEIAEQKAEIKGQIAELQARLDQLAGSATSSQSDIDAAFAILTDRTSAQEKARQDYEQAAQRYNDLNAQLEPLNQTVVSLQDQLATAQASLDSLLAEQQPVEVPEPDEENPNAPAVPTTPVENPSIQNARKTVESLQAQVAQAQAQVQPLQDQVNAAAQEMNNAKAVLDNASAQVIDAQNNYDAIKNAAPSVNGDMEALKSQIQALQNQLDSLQS